MPLVSSTGRSHLVTHSCRSGLRQRHRRGCLLYNRHRWGAAASALLLLLGIGARCRNVTGSPSGEWEQLLHLPGVPISGFDMAPDGTLFIATPDALFRADPASPHEWTLITNTDRFAVELHALSRERVLALVRFGEVYRWSADSGWAPVGHWPDSLNFAPGGARRAYVSDWWIPNEREIYLAGQAGQLLHFDGQVWGRASADGLPLLDWAQIDGDASRMVLGGREIWQRESGRWTQLPGGMADALKCAPMALVLRPAEVIIAGYWADNCLLQFKSGGWSAIGSQLGEFREHPFGGKLQPDGSVLIWSSSGDVARVAGTTVTTAPVPAFFDLGGAGLHAGYLYFAGTNGGDGIVGRVRQP